MVSSFAAIKKNVVFLVAMIFCCLENVGILCFGRWGEEGRENWQEAARGRMLGVDRGRGRTESKLSEFASLVKRKANPRADVSHI